MKQQRFFTEVDYRTFRRHLTAVRGSRIRGRGFETVIEDREGDIQAIVHAASIDEHGRCHPAAYFVRSVAALGEREAA